MSDKQINTGLGDVAYVVRSVEGATAIARGNITNSKMIDRPTPETNAFGGNIGDWIKFAERLERKRDDYKWQLHIAKGEIAEARKMEIAWKKGETK